MTNKNKNFLFLWKTKQWNNALFALFVVKFRAGCRPAKQA